jgi:hypothetical protein
LFHLAPVRLTLKIPQKNRLSGIVPQLAESGLLFVSLNLVLLQSTTRSRVQKRPYLFTCRISGLAVRAEMELPGVIATAVPAGKEDIRVRRRPVPERLEKATTSGEDWDLDGRRFLLRLPGIGRLLASDGCNLDIDTEPGADPAEAMPFLLGTVFGALLLQRGGFVLHASSVAFGGKAWVFCGHRGIGKSTLAAALCQAGCTFVNDDVCRIEADGAERPVVWPDGRRLKLLDESIAGLDLEGWRRDEVQRGIGKYYVEPCGPQADKPVPVGAIYMLSDEAPAGEAGIVQLRTLDAAQCLLNESYRPRLALDIGQFGRHITRHVAVTAAILAHAPVFQLRRVRSLNGLPGTVAELISHWRGLAALAAA